MNFFIIKRLLIICLSLLVITFIPITHLVFIKFYDGYIITNFHIYTCSELYDCYYYSIFNLKINKVILVIPYSFTIFYSVHNLLIIEKISLKKLELLKDVCKIFIHNIGKSILILIIIWISVYFIRSTASSTIEIELSDKNIWDFIFILMATTPIIIWIFIIFICLILKKN